MHRDDVRLRDRSGRRGAAAQRPRMRGSRRLSGTNSSRGTRSMACEHALVGGCTGRRTWRSHRGRLRQRHGGRGGRRRSGRARSGLDVGDRRRRRARPTVSIGTSESAASSEPWLPPPRVMAAAEVDELIPRRGRDEHLAGVRVAQRRLGARAPVRHRVEQREVLVAVAARDELAVLEQHDASADGSRVERSRPASRGILACTPSRRGSTRRRGSSPTLDAHGTLLDPSTGRGPSRRHGVAVEELVRAAGRRRSARRPPRRSARSASCAASGPCACDAKS